MNLDAVRGYVAIWGASSVRIENRDRAFHESIDHGALSWVGKPPVNFDHSESAFADCRIWQDQFGLAFEANLPATVIGAGVRAAFSNRSGAIGVSPRLKVFGRETRSADHDAIVRAQIVHVALTENALFPRSVAWLASSEPRSPEGRAARRHWHLGRIAAEAQVKAPTRRRPAPIMINNLFNDAGRLLEFAKPKDWSAGIGNSRVGAYYSMKAKGETGEILLYSDIGSGGWFSEGTSAEGFAKDLKALGNFSTLNVRINSPGGNVFEGLTIYNLLSSHKAKVVTHIDGLAASIASVVAMAGDEINIADNGMMMIHNAWGVAAGYSNEIRKTADVLDSITGAIANTYAKRSGTNEQTIRSLMAAETWMTADQAKQHGLVDTVVNNMKAAACAFDPKRFKNVPRQLQNSIAPHAVPQEEPDEFAKTIEMFRAIPRDLARKYPGANLGKRRKHNGTRCK